MNDGFLSSPVDYREWHRNIIRVWAVHLDGNEFRMLLFIFDRTAGWGKEWEVIPMRHFLKGVVSSEGIIYAPSLPFSESTIRRILRSLIDKGMLLKRSGSLTRYSLNYEWKEDMKIPKRLQEKGKDSLNEAVTGDRGGVMGDSDERSLVTPHKEKEKEEGKNRICADAPHHAPTRIETREELEHSLARIESKSQAKRSSKSDKGYCCRGKDGGLVPNVEAMRIRWVDLHTKYFEDYPSVALPSKSLHMLRSYAKEWNTRNAGMEWVDFLEWVFKNWREVCSTSFRWMSNPPKAPLPSLVVSSKLRTFLEDAWRNRESLAKLYKLPPRERDIRFMMVDRGLSRELAEKMSRERKDSLEIKSEVTGMRQKLELEKAQFEKQKSQYYTNRKSPPKTKVVSDFDAEIEERAVKLSREDEPESRRFLEDRDNLTEDQLPDWNGLL